MGSIAHAKVSALPDDPAAAAAGEVVPSDWNAAHNMTGIAQTDVGNTFTQPQTFTAPVTVDTSAVAGTSLTIKTKDDNNVIDIWSNGTQLQFAKYFSGADALQYYMQKDMVYHLGYSGGSKRINFNGDDIPGCSVTFSNQCSVYFYPAKDGTSAGYYSYGEYATAGTPLTQNVFYRGYTFAWNGSDGYALHSDTALKLTQQSTTAGDANLDILGNADAVVASFGLLAKTATFYGSVTAAGGNGTYIKLPAMTVANLAAAATAGAGARAFVTDANATTFASVVAGGGANGVPVYSDGTNWRIG